MKFKKKLKVGKLVEIVWNDSAYHDIGWTDEPIEVQPSLIQSVGIVVARTEDGVSITQNKVIGGAGEGGHCNCMSIPVACIKSVNELVRK